MRESWMKGEQERLSWTVDDRVARLAEMQAEVERLNFQIRAAVDDARLVEVPWSKIGGALKLTRQAAQQRYAR